MSSTDGSSQGSADSQPCVRLADEHFDDYVLGADFTAQVCGYASPVFNQPVADWPFRSIRPYRKDYGIDSAEFARYRETGGGGAIFMAWLGERAVGHVVVSRHWNNLAYVDELAVDVSARGLGVARALLDVAQFWAVKQGLPGIMLETQNNNLPACRLYERCGFRLGGIDYLRYQAIDAASHETALFWYRLFADG
ncbi:GNAT family N-acetyltransferase [Pseudomonas putida]|jgi:ribosomal protein S18 acetylase RimI-like enzyme|nr:GNAT family N-acetyltransferase [Pseudomonas putida]